MAVAEVTITPTKAKNVIDGGKPIICPFTFAFCDLAYRVKSGMFKDKVAQKPTMPVSEGKKYLQKSSLVANFEGWLSIGPKPSAATIAQHNNARAATGKKKALNTNSFFILSTPK